MKILLVIGAMAAALTAALVPAFAGGPGGSRDDSDPPPVATITAGPAGPTSATTAEFMFTTNQLGAHFQCSLDGSKFATCVSPLTYSGLGDATHTFQVFAVRSGDQGPTASWSWTVDTVAPAPVSGLRATVHYEKLRLSWTPTADTDHVVLFRSVGAQKTATQVYAGGGTSYTERKFANAFEHHYSFVSYDKTGNASPPADIAVKASAMILAPADGAIVRAKHRVGLRWRAVGRARFYNVQLWRGKHKVLSAWPKRAHVKLTRRWRYKNRTYRLRPGLYAWFVWPAFGRNGAYGKLVGSATFRVR